MDILTQLFTLIMVNLYISYFENSVDLYRIHQFSTMHIKIHANEEQHGTSLWAPTGQIMLTLTQEKYSLQGKPKREILFPQML